MKEIDKLNYRHKLEMVEELISEFRDNASLWSVKKQIKTILHDDGSDIKPYDCMVEYPDNKPRAHKACLVQTDKGKFRAYLYLSYDGWTWINTENNKPLDTPVRYWSYNTALLV